MTTAILATEMGENKGICEVLVGILEQDMKIEERADVRWEHLSLEK